MSVVLLKWYWYVSHLHEGGACCGILGVYSIRSVSFDGNIGVYWVGGDQGMRGVLEPVLGLTDSVYRLDAQAIPTAPLADFGRGYEITILKDCGGRSHPDVDGSRCRYLCGD